MIPTPDISHVGKKPEYRSVYEPAEDTFALLDALEADGERLRALKPRLCVEIGCGSGVVSTFFQTLLKGDKDEQGATGNDHCLVVAVDQNEVALRCTTETAERNQINRIEPVRSNMLSALEARLTQRQCQKQQQTGSENVDREEEEGGIVDVLLFNPPYVPTTDEEEAQAQELRGIESSWAGGTLGTRLVDELISSRQQQVVPTGRELVQEGEVEVEGKDRSSLLEKVLAPGGLFYLVAIAQNNPEALITTIRQSSASLDAEVVLKRRAGREHLFIIRAHKRRREAEERDQGGDNV